MNEVNVIGRLVLDPIVSCSSDESQKYGDVAKFCLSVNRVQGIEKREQLLKAGSNITDMFLVVAYSTLADRVKKYLSKGMRVAIVGNLSSYYMSGDEDTEYKVKIVAKSIEFLGYPKNSYLPPKHIIEKEESLARKHIQNS